MIKGRMSHACAKRCNDVFVIGGEIHTRSSFEIWNGTDWSYSAGTIGATGLQLISQGKNLYLFGGWEDGNLGNKIWKIDHKNQFFEVGNTTIAREHYALFTVSPGFLTNCQGVFSYTTFIRVSFSIVPYNNIYTFSQSEFSLWYRRALRDIWKGQIL